MSSKVILFLILILLLGFLIYLGRQNYFPELNSLKPATSNQTEQSKQTPAPKIEPQPAASLADSAPQEIEPVANTDEPVTVQPVAKQEYILKASFTERTWVWIQVDNNDPREYLFQTGEHFKWIAHDKIDINLGNAGGVNLVLNDKPIAQIGVSGQVVRLTMPGASQTILPSSTNAP
jgi:cytoskeleton protein RodZ